jgi:aspartyl-tRNA(Asn)/glutamyl-tRNA(Gln) amidotransferase subunit B
MKELEKYEPVIGLEIHAQLKTKTKAFSWEKAEYGDAPNTNISVINLAHPGTLPQHNKAAVESSIKMGIACDSDITEYNVYSRKNYFYADLPKGYQITQFDTPICVGGKIEIKGDDGKTKGINLTRIHMEEDTGKSIHDLDIDNTLVDYNRAGTPLIEIVTEPEIKSGDEAYQFISEVRRLVRYLDICDGNMEEGSLRCDANVSIRPKGQKEFGTKVEVKNMNSMSNVKKAIEHEIMRQAKMLDNREVIYSETRSFDAMNGTTFAMRSKEATNDYRFFPEPDLPPLTVSESWVDAIRQEMPALPKALFKKFTEQYKLNEYDALVLIDSKEVANYFISVLNYTSEFKSAANWILGPVKSWLNSNALEIGEFPLAPKKIAEIVEIVKEGKISNSVAEQKIFPAMFEQKESTPLQLAESMNLIQNSDEGFITELVKEVLAKYPDKVEAYKGGKKGLKGLFMGEIMKLSKGKADPGLANRELSKHLD